MTFLIPTSSESSLSKRVNLLYPIYGTNKKFQTDILSMFSFYTPVEILLLVIQKDTILEGNFALSFNILLEYAKLCGDMAPTTACQWVTYVDLAIQCKF